MAIRQSFLLTPRNTMQITCNGTMWLHTYIPMYCIYGIHKRLCVVIFICVFLRIYRKLCSTWNWHFRESWHWEELIYTFLFRRTAAWRRVHRIQYVCMYVVLCMYIHICICNSAFEMLLKSKFIYRIANNKFSHTKCA